MQQSESVTHIPSLFKIFYFVLEYSQFTNNVVIVSGEQRRDSAIQIHVSILPQTPLPSRLSQHWAEFHVLYKRFFFLVTQFKYSSVYMTFPKSLTLPSLVWGLLERLHNSWERNIRKLPFLSAKLLFLTWCLECWQLYCGYEECQPEGKSYHT